MKVLAMNSSAIAPIGLLVISNVFMTFAWYCHLKMREFKWFEALPVVVVILISWGIALFEYCFQVPANRWGSSKFTPVQLKVIQEIITLLTFSVFAVTYLDQKLCWNHFFAFLLIVGAVFLVRMDAANKPASVTDARNESLKRHE